MPFLRRSSEPTLSDVKQSVLHECMDSTKKDAEHSELPDLRCQERGHGKGLSALNLCPPYCIIVNCKTVCLSIRVDDRNFNDVAPMHSHDRPLSLMILA